jgi:hypothetical protein
VRLFVAQEFATDASRPNNRHELKNKMVLYSFS